jgi:hypothetical protein
MRRHLGTAALLTGLAASVATSQPSYELTGEAFVEDVALNADQPYLPLTVQLTGSGGMQVKSVSFVQVDLEMVNSATESGLVEIYVLDAAFDGALPEGLEPQDAANIRGALADETAPANAQLWTEVDGAAELYLVLVLDGEADLTGDLNVTAGKWDDEPIDGKLKVEVVQ